MSISFLGSQKVESGVIASSRPQQMFSSTTTGHTKGIWYQQIAATASPTAWILVQIPRPQTAGDFLIDVGVGAAGVETVVIANLACAFNDTTARSAAAWLIPLFIPAGSRVATRCQATASNSVCDCQVTCFAPMFGGELGLGKVEACGAVTATSLGTVVNPTGGANVKSSWVELIAATTFAYKWVCLSVNHTNALASAASWTVDIGVGGSGAEVVVVPDLAVHGGTTGDTNPAIGLCFPLAIPAGSRVSVRSQCSIVSVNEKNLEIVLHGAG